MNSIIWQKPDGSFASTSITHPATNSNDHAAYLKTVGAVPADWVVSAVDTAIPPKPLSEVKAAKLAKLESARDAATVLDVTALGSTWQADERSQKLLSSAITLASAGAPLPAVWRDTANNDLQVTSLGQLVTIAGAMAAQTQAAYGKSWTLKAQVNAATTSAAVDAVVW